MQRRECITHITFQTEYLNDALTVGRRNTKCCCGCAIWVDLVQYMWLTLPIYIVNQLSSNNKFNR